MGCLKKHKVKEKFCNRCKETKSLNLFYKNCATKDGFSTICKTCTYTRTTTDIKVSNGNRYCWKCKSEKKEIEFVKNKSLPTGFMPYCKKCWSEISKPHKKKWRDKYATEYNRKYRLKNREKRNSKQREYRLIKIAKNKIAQNEKECQIQ